LPPTDSFLPAWPQVHPGLWGVLTAQFEGDPLNPCSFLAGAGGGGALTWHDPEPKGAPAPRGDPGGSVTTTRCIHLQQAVCRWIARARRCHPEVDLLEPGQPGTGLTARSGRSMVIGRHRHSRLKQPRLPTQLPSLGTTSPPGTETAVRPLSERKFVGRCRPGMKGTTDACPAYRRHAS